MFHTTSQLMALTMTHTDLEGTVALLASARYMAHIFFKYTILVTIIDEKQNNLIMNIRTIAI